MASANQIPSVAVERTAVRLREEAQVATADSQLGRKIAVFKCPRSTPVFCCTTRIAPCLRCALVMFAMSPRRCPVDFASIYAPLHCAGWPSRFECGAALSSARSRMDTRQLGGERRSSGQALATRPEALPDLLAHGVPGVGLPPAAAGYPDVN